MTAIFAWIEAAFLWAVAAGLAAGLLACAVWVVDAALGKRFEPRWRHGLWLLVAARLAMPIAPDHSWSLTSLCGCSNLLSSLQGQSATSFRGGDLLVQLEPTPPWESWSIEVGDNPAEAWWRSAPRLSPVRCAALVWLMGATFILLRSATSLVRLRRAISSLAPYDDLRALEALDTCRRRLGVRRRVGLAAAPWIAQPALCGVWRPRVLLPQCALRELSDRQLQMVFLHELAHVRRADVAIGWALTILGALHWLNPAFYLARRQIIRQRELACDAAAMADLSGDEREAYSRLLLFFVERAAGHSNGPMALLLRMAEARRSSQFHLLKERIAMSSVMQRTSRCPGWIAIGAAALLAAVGLADGPNSAEPRPWRLEVKPEPVKEGDPTISAAQPPDGLTKPKLRGPLVTRVYEIDERVLRETEVSDQPPLQGQGLALLLAGMHQAPHEPQSSDAPEIRQEGDRLIVRHDEPTHQLIADELALWSKAGLRQVVVEMRFLTASDELYEQVRLNSRAIPGAPELRSEAPFEPLRSAPEEFRDGVTIHQADITTQRRVPVAARILTAEERGVLLRQAQSDPRASILQAPRITLFNGQTATISNCIQRPFVVGLEGQGKDAKPHVEVINEGLTARLRAAAWSEDGKIRLDADIKQRKIDEVKTTPPPGFRKSQGVSVQAPALTTRALRLTADLAPGEHLIVAGLAAEGQGKEPQSLYLVISPSLLSLEDE